MNGEVNGVIRLDIREIVKQLELCSPEIASLLNELVDQLELRKQEQADNTNSGRLECDDVGTCVR